MGLADSILATDFASKKKKLEWGNTTRDLWIEGGENHFKQINGRLGIRTHNLKVRAKEAKIGKKKTRGVGI